MPILGATNVERPLRREEEVNALLTYIVLIVLAAIILFAYTRIRGKRARV